MFRYCLFLFLIVSCSSPLKNHEGEKKEFHGQKYRLEKSFGHLKIRPLHKQWKKYPFKNYDERLNFLKEVSYHEMSEGCGEKNLRIDVKMTVLETEPSLFFNIENPAGLIVDYNCKIVP